MPIKPDQPAPLPPGAEAGDLTAPDAEAAYQALLGQVRPVLAEPGLLVVGIHSGGAWIAGRLVADGAHGGTADGKLAGSPVELGFLSSAFHRDDYGSRGLPDSLQSTRLPLSIDERDILLVDDILHTGRTIRASLNELFDYGRPRSVRLAVLIDRGGRQLPVQPDFLGLRLVSRPGQRLRLRQDADGVFEVAIMSAGPHDGADE